VERRSRLSGKTLGRGYTLGVRGVAPLLALAIYAGAEELPLAPGVSAEITSDKTEFAIGDPILLDIVYRNDGKETWEVEEFPWLRFDVEFDVRDAEGKRVPNPYDELESSGPDYFTTLTHTLRPGNTVTVRKYLNECVTFERPGEYVVLARAGNDSSYLESSQSTRLSEPHDKGGRVHRCVSKPLKIKILPERDRKTRDAIASDLKRLHDDPELRKREEYAHYRPYLTEDKGKSDALRLLVFRRDQELLPLWLGLLGDGAAGDEKGVYRRIDLVWEGLAGLPDRAAVLKALEERLKGPQRNRCLVLYIALAVPKTEDVSWRDVDTRRNRLSAELSERFPEPVESK